MMTNVLVAMTVLAGACSDAGTHGAYSDGGMASDGSHDALASAPPPDAAETAATAVDGVCGPSAGGAFSAAPTSGLCNAGTASTVSGSGPFAWSCAGSNGGVTAECQASLSANAEGCGPEEVMGADDLVWSSFKSTQLWPIPPVTGSGDSGRAVQFVADSAAYPRGVQMVGIDESNRNGKNYVISDCPHRFAPVGGNERCTLTGVGSYGGPLYLRFGPGTSSYDCPLTPGGTYYVNFRDYFTPRGDVSSQFVIYSRTD